MGKELVAYVAEHGEHIYIQAPVGLYAPEPATVETLAFSEDIKKLAPNPKIMWLQGRYVEADNANRNGDQWTAGELAIKSLTPVFMPITVMHDMRTAVGTIADTRLRLPDKEPDIPRARIETMLALWAHRFPDVAEEARINAEQGTLMQSMECLAPNYECSACGMAYQRLPGGAERETWCAHLRGEALSGDGRPAARTLGNVTFTGTGLIFGTRGARGAYPEAFLEVEAVAEVFAKAREIKTPKTKKRSTSIMEIEDAKYAELVAQAQKAETLEAKVATLEPELATAKSAAETAEAAKVKAEEEAKAEKTRADAAEEATRVATLRDERMGKLGTAFVAKLDKMPTTKASLNTQAGTLSDEAWTARLAELVEATGVKEDAAIEGGGGGSEEQAADLFTDEQVASAGVGSGAPAGGGAALPTAAARQSVVGGLIAKKKQPAAA